MQFLNSLYYPFSNPPLPYSYQALEPYIDAKTMELHHNRHLQTYIDNLNLVLADAPAYQALSLDQLLENLETLPADIRTKVKNNAGGVYNHIFFFNGMKNPSTNLPEHALIAYIKNAFGSFEAFQSAFTKAALSVFGSGYAWLVLDALGRLQIITTSGQDTPLADRLCPVLNLDVWEHAYYLKHYNDRAAYIKDWFHVINWPAANRRLTNCLFTGLA